jgi:hypothetical protein
MYAAKIFLAASEFFGWFGQDHVPEQFAAEFLADYYKNGRKVAELFLKCVIDIKALISGRNKLFNTLMDSTFL